MSVDFCLSDAPTTGLYTLSLHDALPISWIGISFSGRVALKVCRRTDGERTAVDASRVGGRVAWSNRMRRDLGVKHRCCVYRSEEHTSELQSREKLVCRLLLEKKKKKRKR